jgi:biopolymer transport protein ExbD
VRKRTPRKRGYLAGLSKPAELRMTSMMDIFTVLLLFLLKSFVVGGEVVNPPPGLELPRSTAEAPPQESLIIAIDDDAISLGSERVMTIDDAVADEDMILELLDERLQAVITQRDEIAALRGATETEDEVVTIQGDRQIEFRVLQKVMYTLNYNGFENISLAVIRTAGG